MSSRSGGFTLVNVAAAGGAPSSRVVNGTSPIRINGGASGTLASDVTVSILPATTSQDGSMSSTQVQSLNMADPMATFPSFGTVKGLFQGVGCTDFLTTGAGTAPFTTQSSGTGAATTSGTLATTARPGVLDCATGTDATGRAATLVSTASVCFGGGEWRWRSDVNIAVASDATNTFVAQAGFIDSVTVESTDCAYFRYLYDENGGNWTCVTRANGGAFTTTNSGVAAVHATAFRALEIRVNAAATEVLFVIDGVTVATHTTNIPSGNTMQTGAGVVIRKTVGATSRTASVDVAGLWFNSSGVR